MNNQDKTRVSTKSNNGYSEAVENLQRYLRQISFTDNDIPTVPIDGIWESATRDSVRAFQRKNRLQPTGRVNNETWDRIFSEYEKSKSISAVPLTVPLFPRIPYGYVAEKGSEGFLVMAIQHMLNELLTEYKDFYPTLIAEDGIYGEETENAVNAYQEYRGLEGDGKTDILTWNDIVRLYSAQQRKSE